MKKILSILIAITLLLNIQFLFSQTHFEQETPTNFESIGIQLDLFGSIDKEGLNTVISYNNVKWDVVQLEVQIQSIFTGKYISKGWELDYLDIQAGFGRIWYLSNRITITPGIHAGWMARPKARIIDRSYHGLTGGIIAGVTLQGRWMIGKTKRMAFTISGAYDYRYDNCNMEINGRAGMEYLFGF